MATIAVGSTRPEFARIIEQEQQRRKPVIAREDQAGLRAALLDPAGTSDDRAHAARHRWHCRRRAQHELKLPSIAAFTRCLQQVKQWKTRLRHSFGRRQFDTMSVRERAMRIVFGVLSLLVVLAIVGVVAKKQLQSLRAPLPAETAAGAGMPAQQSQQLQKKVQDDVNKLMQQAPARAEPTQ